MIPHSTFQRVTVGAKCWGPATMRHQGDQQIWFDSSNKLGRNLRVNYRCNLWFQSAPKKRARTSSSLIFTPFIYSQNTPITKFLIYIDINTHCGYGCPLRQVRHPRLLCRGSTCSPPRGHNRGVGLRPQHFRWRARGKRSYQEAVLWQPQRVLGPQDEYCDGW